MPNDYATIPPSPDNEIYIVEATVNPPIGGDPEAALVTVQPVPE